VSMNGVCAWSAVSSDTSWLTIDDSNSGTGNGTIGYSYTRYDGAPGTSRSATLTVTVPGVGVRTFTLIQTRP
jgi:hypothetical protein